MKKRLVSVLLAFIIMLNLLTAAPATVFATTSPETLASEVVAIINTERKNAGLKPLSSSSFTLNSAAKTRAEEITVAFEWNRPNGKEWETVLDDFSVKRNDQAQVAGRTTYSSAAQAVQFFMEASNGRYKEDILNPNFTDIGVGVVVDTYNDRYYWALLLIDSFAGCPYCRTEDPDVVCGKCNGCHTCTQTYHCDTCALCRWCAWGWDINWCDNCQNCRSHCTCAPPKGRIVSPPHGDPTIADALEILKFIVGMANKITRDGVGSNAWNAALIVSNTRPGVSDALEILKYLVYMPNRIGINPTPSAPRNFSATAGNGQVTLTWNPPIHQGSSPIYYYEIRRDNAGWITLSPFITSYTFAGLTNGVRYTFQIRAVNHTHTGATVSVTASPRAPGGGTRPTFWHSDGDWVGFWDKSIITVNAQTLGSVSSAFEFTTRVNEAREQWSSTLSATINITSSSTADIYAYGGRRDALRAHSGDYQPWAGLCIYSPMTRRNSITLSNGVRKDVFVFIGSARIYVLEKSPSASWTNTEIDMTKTVTTHELGHALGYRGHPIQVTANNQDVMWFMEHTQFTLRENEKRHLRQIYTFFR